MTAQDIKKLLESSPRDYLSAEDLVMPAITELLGVIEKMRVALSIAYSGNGDIDKYFNQALTLSAPYASIQAELTTKSSEQ